jgi:RNA polymerase sigma factor (sigma-70 family)
MGLGIQFEGSRMDWRETDATSVTLLVKLRDDPTNQAVWQEFVRRYRPLIYGFCLSWHLQPADAEDITQAVLTRLVNKMRDFRYDPAQSFRGWLKTVTRHVLANELAKRRRERVAGDGVVVEMLLNVQAQDGLVGAVEAAYDRELLDEALRRVRERVPAQQWDAFRLTALESMSGADASRTLGMLVSTVYSSKSKVQKLLREELRRLDI